MKYLYKIDGLADWTKKTEFQTAFPYIAQIIDAAGKKEQQGGVKLTSQFNNKGLYENNLSSSYRCHIHCRVGWTCRWLRIRCRDK